jgi:hypothetical protein
MLAIKNNQNQAQEIAINKFHHIFFSRSDYSIKTSCNFKFQYIFFFYQFHRTGKNNIQ